MTTSGFKSGYVAIVGRPNVGKSTLFNALVGEKLAAITDKPQTTRHRILGIRTTAVGQILFLDMPGIHEPHKNLNEYMMEVVRATFDDADLFLFLTEPTEKISEEDRMIYRMLRDRKKPVFLLINKVDTVSRESLPPLVQVWQREFQPDRLFPLAARLGDGLAGLEEGILERLPEGPPYYPEDQVSDRDERFFASEIIREQATDLTRQEIPYSLTVEIEEYREPREEDLRKITRIRASLIVEKESQKGILIGKKGSMIKQIGQESRRILEERVENQVYLELFVRVEKDWTKNPNKLREFGYT